MSTSYAARKCPQCAGKLDYKKEKKVWECLYCGAIIEREEKYDGLFTVKNVVCQALRDISNRRMDSAMKNITECEKIDSRYVGTVISKMAYYMILPTVSGACTQSEARNCRSLLAREYRSFSENGKYPSDDEEALYDFIEDSDVFATLFLVFDSLGEAQRCKLIETHFDAGKIYSKDTNAAILSHGLRNGNSAFVDGVIGNPDNLDCRYALAEVLARHADDEDKIKRVKKLTAELDVSGGDNRIFEKYITESGDTAKTKAAVTAVACGKGIKINTDLIVALLAKADEKTVVELCSAMCRTKLSDAETDKLTTFACGADYTAGTAVLNVLKDSGQYVFAATKNFISLLLRQGLSAEEKLAEFRMLSDFKHDAKAIETAVSNYLGYSGDDTEKRFAVIDGLLKELNVLPTRNIENYVVNCRVDGAQKPRMVNRIFELPLNMSFFNDLPSKYMAGSADSPEVKSSILEILLEKGLRPDSGVVGDYVCASGDRAEQKLKIIEMAVNNGVRIQSSAASKYLETVAAGDFNQQIFDHLCVTGSKFSIAAVQRYIFVIRDSEHNRIKNIGTVISQCMKDVGSIRCSFTHLGSNISGNLLQAYILVGKDTDGVMRSVADALVNRFGVKINADITVSGSSMKFKKYISANKDKISSVAMELCEKYKLFSSLF